MNTEKRHIGRSAEPPLFLSKALEEPGTSGSAIAVIDTETNFQNKVMSIGAVIADAKTYRIMDAIYYVITPECTVSAMYSGALYITRPLEPCSRSFALADLRRILAEYDVHSLCAYNASFDREHLPELQHFGWYDIMKLAADRQYNHTITNHANCTTTGRLRSGYGVEPTLQRLLEDPTYHETHNALLDAQDELKIMELLGHPWKTYHEFAYVGGGKTAP